MDHLISYLKVEIKRIERILDGDYADFMTLEEYHYEKGRVEALEYVWKRLEEILKDETYHYEKGRADALEYVLKRLSEILEEEK